MKVFIFGCGYSGQAVGKRIGHKGHAICGTSRSVENLDKIAVSGVQPFLFDGLTLDPKLVSELSDVTHLLISIAPPRQETAEETGQMVDPVLETLRDRSITTLMPDLSWIGYLSTVGVYGSHDGAWVDETTPVKPTSPRSRQRVRAENEWIDTAGSLDVPLCIFRLSGIYGPGRNALRSAHESQARRLIKKGQVFNRIHVDDIARAVDLAIEQRSSGVFNITDDEPSPPQNVVELAHELLGREPPEEIDFEKADLTPMARSFYGDNKRVSNSLSKSELHMVYKYPNYRVALHRMHDETNW